MLDRQSPAEAMIIYSARRPFPRGTLSRCDALESILRPLSLPCGLRQKGDMLNLQSSVLGFL